MAGRGVEEVVQLLDVLAVVAFGVGQAEQPLLEDRVSAVPQRHREAEPLLVIGEAAEAVLAPAVGPAPGVVVRQVIPCRAFLTVVLPDRAPLPLREVGPEATPRALSPRVLFQPSSFRRNLTHRPLRG